MLYALSIPHITLFSWSLAPNLQLPYKKPQCGTATRTLFAVSAYVFITITDHPPAVAERK